MRYNKLINTRLTPLLQLQDDDSIHMKITVLFITVAYIILLHKENIKDPSGSLPYVTSLPFSHRKLQVFFFFWGVLGGRQVGWGWQGSGWCVVGEWIVLKSNNINNVGQQQKDLKIVYCILPSINRGRPEWSICKSVAAEVALTLQ